MNTNDLNNNKNYKRLTVAGTLAALVSAITLSSNATANMLFDDRMQINFLALQNFQAIQAEEGAFRPEDEEQASGFGRLRLNLQMKFKISEYITCLLYTSPSPRDLSTSRMPSSA